MSDTEQPDPAKALLEGIQVMGRVIGDWFERMRPVIEQLAEVMNRPEVRAVIEQAQARRLLCEMRPCHCLCGKAHPAEKGICDMDGVTTRRFETELLGPVDVPLCAPCAVAQGMVEMAAGQ